MILPINALQSAYARICTLPEHVDEASEIFARAISVLQDISGTPLDPLQKKETENILIQMRTKLGVQKAISGLSEDAIAALRKLDDLAIETLNALNPRDRVSDLPMLILHDEIMGRLDRNSQAAFKMANKQIYRREYLRELSENPNPEPYKHSFDYFLLAGMTSEQAGTIKYFNLSGNKKFDAGQIADLIRRLPNLERLNLSSTAVDEEGFKAIPKKMSHLIMGNCLHLPKELSVAELPNLRLLAMRSNTKLVAIHGLNELKELESLDLGLCIKLTTKVLDRIRHSTSLKRLILSHVPIDYTQRTLNYLARLTQLVELDISKAQIRGDLSVLSALQALQTLSLAGCSLVSDLDQLKFLKELPSLREVNLEGLPILPILLHELKNHNPNLQIKDGEHGRVDERRGRSSRPSAPLQGFEEE